MTTRHLLTQERKAAERGVRLEHIKTAVFLGSYIPNALDRTIDFWDYTMSHNCPNKGAEMRNCYQNQLDYRLHLVDNPKHYPPTPSNDNPLVYCPDCACFYDATVQSVICNNGQHARLDESED